MFEKRRVGRANIRAADHFHLRIGEGVHGPAQIAGRRHRIVIEKINQVVAGDADGRVALNGRLFAARDDNFQFVPGIIELFAGGHGFDFRLIRSGGNHNGHTWQLGIHGGQRRVSKFKVQSLKFKTGDRRKRRPVRERNCDGIVEATDTSLDGRGLVLPKGGVQSKIPEPRMSTEKKKQYKSIAVKLCAGGLTLAVAGLVYFYSAPKIYRATAKAKIVKSGWNNANETKFSFGPERLPE